MNISSEATEILKQLEGLHLKATRVEGEWRLGYGHRAGVNPGDEITEDDAEALLDKDLKLSSKVISRSLDGEIPQHQFDALVLFGYSMGTFFTSNSTLMDAVIAQDVDAAVEELQKWSKKLRDRSLRLVQRRQCEVALFKGQIEIAEEIAGLGQ